MHCVSPIRMRDDKNGGFKDVPCGKCYECKRNRQLDWAFRIKQEQKVCDYSVVITFTYSEENRPLTSRGIPTLRRKDIQLFFKRLRKSVITKYGKSVVIRYFGVGEYGSDPRRSHHPHYHIIFFVCGLPRSLFEEKARTCWDYGFIYCDSVSDAVITYVTKYCLKDGLYNLDPLEGEHTFSMMSLKPAIGSNYLNQKERLQDGYLIRPFDYVEGGQKARIPRYYRDKWNSNKVYKELFVDARQEVAAASLRKKAKHKEDIYKKTHGGNEFPLYEIENQKQRNSLNQQNKTEHL